MSSLLRRHLANFVEGDIETRRRAAESIEQMFLAKEEHLIGYLIEMKRERDKAEAENERLHKWASFVRYVVGEYAKKIRKSHLDDIGYPFCLYGIDSHYEMLISRPDDFDKAEKPNEWGGESPFARVMRMRQEGQIP